MKIWEGAKKEVMQQMMRAARQIMCRCPARVMRAGYLHMMKEVRREEEGEMREVNKEGGEE